MHTESPAIPESTVKHYSVPEIAKLWGVSDDTIRRIFEAEPGVLILGEAFRGKRRVKRTMRIPANVLQRVHERRSTK
jgi:hypothetical protein